MLRGVHERAEYHLAVLLPTTDCDPGAVTDPRLLPYLTPALLEEVAHHPMENRYPNAAHMLRDILHMLQEVLPVAVMIRPIRSLQVLRNQHDDLVGGLNTRNPAMANMAFPEPPLPGNDAIIPITTVPELAEEGRVQHNCVASHARRVRDSQFYIYRVVRPERCTLALLHRDNEWEIFELKRGSNLYPSAETVRAVSAWFYANKMCR